MKIVDRVLAWILIVGGLLHGVGSYLGYRKEPLTMLWALSGTQLALVLGAINLLRVVRAADRPLAWICFVGNITWAISAFTFGALIGNFFDFRALVHGLSALALAGFSLKAALLSSQTQR